MNKKNMLLIAGLLVSVATTALSVGEQQREILYSLRELGQDFTQEPMIQQNVDMFIGMFQLNSKLLEARLQVADKNLKKTFLFSVALVLGTELARALSVETLLKVKAVSSSTLKIRMLGAVTAGTSITTDLYNAMALYDAFKERKALRAALTVDQEILESLAAMKAFDGFNLNLAANGDNAHDSDEQEDVFTQELANEATV